MFDKRYFSARYGANVAGVRTALRIAHITPANTALIFDINSSDFRPTPFGGFLFEAAVIVEKILRRNIGLGHDSFLEESSLRSSALAQLGIFNREAAKNNKNRTLAAFETSAEEVARLPHLLTPQEIISILDMFAWVSYPKEQPVYMNELGRAWDRFRKAVAHDASFTPLISLPYFLSRLADNGVEELIAGSLNSLRTQDIEHTLRIHESCAEAHGIESRKHLIKAILKKYDGVMRPIILQYRKLVPEIVSQRRAEFSTRTANTFATRLDFLRSVNDPALKMELYRGGFPLQKLQAMAHRGSFGQEMGARHPHMITVEHMTPLTSGDNYLQNFALATMGANEDTNRLIKYQTDFLESDRVRRVSGALVWEFVANTVQIVALRPPMLRYGNGKTFPGFMRHPAWDWKLA